MHSPRPIPSKFETATPRVLADVRRGLGRHISGRPTSRSSWAFYEELDAWLGPWGASGYPIAYGKVYAEAFTTHRHLLSSPHTRAWVFRTAEILQEELLSFVLRRMQQGSLPELSESELRRVAFASHAGAYDRAGLAQVVVRAPELVPWIAFISRREFDPRSENFVPTLDQAIRAVNRVAPKAMALAALRSWLAPLATGLELFEVGRERALARRAA